MSICRILLTLILIAAASLAAAAGVQVTYPAGETAYDQRHRDLVEMLRMALEKTVPEYGPFELGPAARPMSKARYLTGLRSGQDINITWSSTSLEMEATYLPIRIPLGKGLLGFRIALIAKEKQALIDRVKTADDLRHLTIGQGIDWGDSKVYEALGAKVVSAKYENLFQMTGLQRFDMFPRGIGEIFAEFEQNSRAVPNLVVEQHLLIEYPWPYYYFFNKKDTALKARIEAGLRKMIKDGSSDAIFWKYNGAAIARANLKGRRIIHLTNTLLPKETPLGDRSLWFDPSK